MESHRRKIDCKTIRLEQKLSTNNIVFSAYGYGIKVWQRATSLRVWRLNEISEIK